MSVRDRRITVEHVVLHGHPAGGGTQAAGAVSFESLMAATGDDDVAAYGKRAAAAEVRSSWRRLFIPQGTTGEPKGALMLSHANFVSK